MAVSMTLTSALLKEWPSLNEIIVLYFKLVSNVNPTINFYPGARDF